MFAAGQTLLEIKQVGGGFGQLVLEGADTIAVLLFPSLEIRFEIADFGGDFGGDTTIGVDARSEEHTSELQSLMRISYAVFCLKKKNNKYTNATSQSTTTILLEYHMY